MHRKETRKDKLDLQEGTVAMRAALAAEAEALEDQCQKAQSAALKAGMKVNLEQNCRGPPRVRSGARAEELKDLRVSFSCPEPDQAEYI